MDDVRESFLRLTEARSAEEVATACEADPRMLDPSFEAFLVDLEDELRADGQDVSLMSAWRLVLRSVRALGAPASDNGQCGSQRCRG